jgi:protein-serine/threonine kinase
MRVLLITLRQLVLVLLTQGSSISALEDHHRCNLDYSLIYAKSLSGSNLESYGRHLQTIGHGTSAKVSIYLQYIDNKTVAVKEYIRPACTEAGIREIKLEYFLGSLASNIPSIAPTLDLIHVPSTCQWFLISEYVPHSLVSLHNTLDTCTLIDIILNLEASVYGLHDIGISHGDIKLENLLLTADHKPMLIDFGAATLHYCDVDAVNPETNVAPGDYGTPGYLPPEVFTSLRYDRVKADLWALGVLAHVLFTGTTSWKVASLSDNRWREFLGVETERAVYCKFLDTRLSYPACVSSMTHILSDIPEEIRGLVAGWLDLNPMYRG